MKPSKDLVLGNIYAYSILEKSFNPNVYKEKELGSFIIDEHKIYFENKKWGTRYYFILSGYINQGIYKFAGRIL